MPSGSCFCGQLGIQFDASRLVTSGLCHCTDCRKQTGSTYSTNLIVPRDALTVTCNGAPVNFDAVAPKEPSDQRSNASSDNKLSTLKQYKYAADSGTTITTTFCGECGSTLFSYGAVADAMVVKAGCLDFPPSSAGGDPESDEVWTEIQKPQLELYTKRRLHWVNEVDGATQVEGMLGI